MISNGPFLIYHRGAPYEVSYRFHQENSVRWPDLASTEREGLYAAILADLRTSEERALSDDERELLEARVRHYNVRSAIVFLAGRSLRDFGMEYVDQVHGMRATFDCGCQLHYVFDHYLARALAADATPELIVNGLTDLTTYPHYPHHVCQAHRHLAGDLTALHTEVTSTGVIQ